MPAISTAAFCELWDRVWHKPDETARVIAAAYTDDFLQHISSLPSPIQKTDWISFVVNWQAAFPDGRMVISDLVSADDKVWCYWTSSGTHSREYLGVRATGRHVHYRGTDIYRFTEDKIAECWSVPDVLTLLRQLGALSK
jgi:steroid delta-isomerase-like uncharacterized protein